MIRSWIRMYACAVLAGACLVSAPALAADTVVPGKLTVAIPDFPYPGFLEGTDPTAPTQGYYVDMANEIGKRLGLEVVWTPADFTAFISGQFKDYDIAADSFSITPVRQEKFNMTSPVYSYHEGLMTKAGVPVATADDIRKLTLGSCGACDTFQFIQEVIKPTKEPRGFDMDLSKYDAVISGAIDGAIGDLPVILAKVATPKYSSAVAACQFAAAVDAAWILPKDSKIFPQVQKILADLKSEGKFEEWQKKNVVPTMGGVDPNTIPKCADF